ncbi:MAG: pyrroline-5-carboxylate reductase [Actinomycetota bacterium]
MHKLSIIGCGNMGEAILGGIIESGILDKKSIGVYDRDENRREYIREKYPVAVYDRIKDAIISPYILLAIKPQDLPAAAAQLKEENIKGKKMISIVAGVPTHYFEKKLGKIGVIRIMPNTPALVRKGVFVLSRGRYAGDEDMSFANRIMSSLGKTITIDEDLQNLATALSGSGPAYFFFFCKSMIEAAVKQGMEEQTAKKLVVGTMAGSAEVIEKSGLDIDKLIRMVASPGGTTERALAEFDKSCLQDIVKKAVDSALRRANELESLLDI